MDRNFLFQVMFILQNPPRRTPAFPGLSARFVDVDPGIARVDLMLELMDSKEGLRGWFEYSTDLFEAETVARLAKHYAKLLGEVVTGAELGEQAHQPRAEEPIPKPDSTAVLAHRGPIGLE